MSGAGLGLEIVKNAVDLHGDTTTAFSQEGEGSDCAALDGDASDAWCVSPEG